MSPREERTQPTSLAEARVLVERAKSLMTAADLLLDDELDGSSQSAAAAVAIIAGIAASDAVCAAAVGRRSRGQDHRAAVNLLRQSAPESPSLADALNTLLDIKDQAHYGVTLVKRADAVRAVRRAHALLDAARAALAS